MEPLYSETYLDAKPSAKRIQKRIALIGLCFVLLFVDLFILHSAIGLFLVVIIDGLIIVLLPSKDIAYEYVFVDGQIDFDCIFGGNRRKTMQKIDLEKTDIVAPEGSHALDSYQRLELKDYSSGYDEHRHFILAYRGDDGVSVRIRFTPDEKLLENMKMKARSKVQTELR